MRSNPNPLTITTVASLALLLTACPSTTGAQLNQDRAREISIFGASAMTGTTSFLRGAPITAESVGRELERLARSNPRLETFLDRYTPRLQNAFSPVRSQAKGTDCGSNISGSQYTDADGDGIYQNSSGGDFVYDFDCNSSSLYGGSVLTGRVVVRDANDRDPTSGYTYKLSNFKFVYTDVIDQQPVNLTLVFNADTTVAKAAVTGKYTVSQGYSFGFEASAGTAKLTANFSDNSTLTYTPASATTPTFNQGFIDASSKFTYGIAGQFDNGTFSGGGTFNVQYINMYVDRGSGCNDVTQAAGKDAKVVFSDDASPRNTLTWDINGCAQGVWTYAAGS